MSFYIKLLPVGGWWEAKECHPWPRWRPGEGSYPECMKSSSLPPSGTRLGVGPEEARHMCHRCEMAAVGSAGPKGLVSLVWEKEGLKGR